MSRFGNVLPNILLLIFSLFVLGFVVYFSYAFPKRMQSWEVEGRALSPGEKTNARISGFCREYGVIFIPIALAGAGLSVIMIVQGRSD